MLFLSSEAYQRAGGAIEPALELRAEINSHPLISKHFRVLEAEMTAGESLDQRFENYLRPGANWAAAVQALRGEESAFDVTRITLVCDSAAYDDAHFTETLATICELRIRKTLREGVVFEMSITNSRREFSRLIGCLLGISVALELRLHAQARKEFAEFNKGIKLPTPDPSAAEPRAMSTTAT
jgi:hypothetical protein